MVSFVPVNLKISIFSYFSDLKLTLEADDGTSNTPTRSFQPADSSGGIRRIEKELCRFQCASRSGWIESFKYLAGRCGEVNSMIRPYLVAHGLLQENEKSSVKLWQRVLNFLNRYSWTPLVLPSSKPTVQVGSQKDIKKESKVDRGGLNSGATDEKHSIVGSDRAVVAASAVPEAMFSNGAQDGKLAKVEPALQDPSSQACTLINSSTSELECNGSKVEPIAMQIEGCSNAEFSVNDTVVKELDAETSQPALSSDHCMEDVSPNTIVKLEGADMREHLSCDSSSQGLHIVEMESEKPIDLSDDTAEVRVSQTDKLAFVHIHEKIANSLAQDDSHLRSNGDDSKTTKSPIDNTAVVDSITTDAGSERSVMSPRAPDSNMQIVDACDGSASESGTPRLSDSREPSESNLGGADCASRESTEPVVATLLVSSSSAASSKAEKSRKESKSKSDKNGKGKTAHELVVLIVEV
jgi:hypothetical protein